MKKSNLQKALEVIAREFKGEIDAKNEKYVILNLGNVFKALNLKSKSGAKKYNDTSVVIPMKREFKKCLNVIVNGNNFANHVQFESGIVVPAWVGEESKMFHKPYQPARTMVLMMKW
ncbi:MAG: hypothetical protein A3D65_01040 [Candidatus Lloydbacteria bacterium RIFCSPHIGHO2_02_FULL_50_13]|uniref:Uncharacterized protein n=1 Tax=Candidatus Lloydbacteria bacterium RIFCSPHIGHO2_02_FULL_50_13 TaxID=1798661 RepID=A0A1G2D5V0_9BACT|nr:MAG: hypothetical protein A3D65_01040 [Candidatus Lloydbacteria bacterium RIFCSPHIGHO2_02_FULL_50_13]